MLIRFDELARTVVPHMKGGEGEAQLQSVADADNQIMRSVLAPGASIGAAAAPRPVRTGWG